MSDAVDVRPSRHRAALRRWSILAIALATIGVVAGELVGGTWPVTLVTPLARQLGAMLTLGAGGLLILRFLWRDPATPPAVARRDRNWLILSLVVRTYAGLLTLDAVPGRVVPAALDTKPADADFGRLKILSANVHSSNVDHASLLALIARERPDVVLLMELTTPWTTALKTLDADYPTRQVVADDAGNFGIGVWTRLPADDARLVVRQRLAQPSLLDVAHAELTLRLNGHRVHVVGAHPLPPLTPSMSGARDALLRKIADEIAADPSTPAIVAGDLNATRTCWITRELCRTAHLRDATARIDTSWPMTFARPILGIRIDQVLCDDAWRVVETHAGPNVGSDHLPMIATLQLTRETR